MNHRPFTLSIITALWMLTVPSSIAQTEEQLDFWNETLSEKSLNEIAITINGTAAPSWPNAASSHRIQSMSAKERALAERAVVLVKALHAKVRENFERSGADSGATIETYTEIANALDRAGGYSNILLADALRRLAIFRVSDWLIKGSQPLPRVQEMVNRLTASRVDLRSLLERLASEDRLLNENRERLETISPSQNIFAVAEAIGFDRSALMTASDFSELLENPSALGLAMRLAGTELLSAVSLQGLLAFLQRGGTYQELDPADVTAFQKRMGGSEKLFRSTPLGVRYLSVSHPRSLFEIHNDPIARKTYLEAALK
jgi:hypothetical protein